MPTIFQKLNIVRVIFGLLMILSFTLVPVNVFAGSGTGAATNAVCNGVAAVSGSNCTNSVDTAASIHSIIKDIINILSWLVGVVAIIMIIIGGFSYTISSGDPTKGAKARSTILYAIIGLLVVGISQILVKLVFSQFFK